MRAAADAQGESRAEHGAGQLPMFTGNERALSRFGLPALAGGAVLLGLYASSLYNYLLFHSLVEIFSVVVSFAVFVLAWNTREVQENHYLLFIGIASLSAAALEMVHTVAYKGYGVFPDNDANLPTQLWIAFRYVSSLTFLLAPLFISRKLDPLRVFSAYLVVTTLLFWAIFTGSFPDCFIEGKGLTPFKIASEYVIILIYLAALGFLLRRRRSFDRLVLRLLAVSLIASIASEAAFTQYASVYGQANMIGHLFLLISVYCVYRAIVVTGMVAPARLLFRDLKQSEEALRESEAALQAAHDDLEIKVRERTAELKRTNEELEAEIAERRRAEARTVRLAAAVEAAAEAVVLAGADGTIQYVNPAFERTTGYSRAEAVGRGMEILDSGRRDALSYRDLRERMAGGDGWSGRIAQRRKDGTLYFEDCTISPVRDPSGRIVNYVFIKRDVTEKLRLESIAESVSMMDNIGSVFAGVRHEIGNPVNSANMVLRILTSKLDDLPREKVREYLRSMTEQLGRVEFILRSLRSFNLFETQEPQNVPSAPFLENFLPLVRADFAKKGIRIESAVARGAETMHADPRALQQVLLNVMTNAADALEGREDPRIDLAASRSNGRIVIQVKDNGSGIAPDKVREIFRPFFTTKPHGTGLGLVIVRKMLANMNGTIDIQSEPQEGTVVTITVPCGKET